MFRNIKDGNLNVNINRQDTVAFCLTIIFIAMTVFIGVGSGIICYKLGNQAEKISWLENKQMEMIEWQKGIERTAAKEAVKELNK